MNGVIYYSNTGESQKVAQYVATKLNFPLLCALYLDCFDYENLVIVFPVHCQNIPKELLPVFKRLKAQNVVILATYGKMCYGNVIYECKVRYNWRIVGGAYIPTKHTYIVDDTPFTQFELLNFVISAFERCSEVSIPKCYKNPLANLFISLRTELGVKLIRDKSCDNCGICTVQCPHKSCIRCLYCMQNCPTGALKYKLNFFMKLYLKKKKIDDLIIYDK